MVGPRFAIVRQLGAGGMGVVYEAHDRARNERVALKTLARCDGDALYRFKREFRALSDITHANLVSLFELFATERGWFFTMELVAGKPLLTALRAHTTSGSGRRRELAADEDPPTAQLDASRSGVFSTPADEASSHESDVLPPSLVREVFVQLATALDALHRQARVHRDVKPSNVMITPEGRVVVLDFGIIGELGGARVRDDAIVGTPAYMAPEQALPNAVPSPAGDWYSFGVVLYEALAGRRPFLGSTTQVLTAKNLIAPPSLSCLAPETPADLVALCHELLSSDPARRPGGAEVIRRLAGGEIDLPAEDVVDVSGTCGFVGRKLEMRRLERALADAHAGRPRAVLVGGMSGMGKTSLVERLLALLEGEPDVVVLRGRCYERESVPYKALDSLVDALSQWLAHEPDERVAAMLPPDIGILAAAFPVLLQVPAIASRRAEGGSSLRERALRALTQLLRTIGQTRTLVLFADDVQWGDVDSASVLAELGADVRARILLVATYRREDRDRSPFLDAFFRGARAAGASLDEISIQPLDDDDLHALTRSVVGKRPDAEDVIRHVIAEAAGSAYLALELARHAAAHGGRGEHGSLESVHLARVARLSPDARRLLEVLVVSGAPVSRRVLTHAATSSSRMRSFVELAARGFVKTVRAQTETLDTQHDSVREAVLARIEPDAQREMHGALAAALEREDKPDVHAIARHWFHAWPSAPAAVVFEACTRAGDRAAKSYAWDDALVHLERARQVAMEAKLSLDGDFFRLHALAAARSGHIEEATTSIHAALALVDEPVVRAELRCELTKIHLGQLDIAAGEAEGKRGLAELGLRDWTPGVWSILTAVLAMLFDIGSRRLRLRTSRRSVGEIGVLAKLMIAVGHAAYFRLSPVAQVHAVLQMGRIIVPLAYARVEPASVRPDLANWYGMVAVFSSVAGLHRLARRAIRSAMRTVGAVPDRTALARVYQYRGHALNMCGDPVGGVVALGEALRVHGDALENMDYLTGVADLAGIHLLRGRAHEGLEWTTRGLERTAIDRGARRLTEGHTYRCYAATLLALLGRAAEGRQHLEEFARSIRVEDRWRRAQWLAHSALFFAEVGGEPEELEDVLRDFSSLRLSVRRLPIQIRHVFIAQAMIRLAQVDGSPASILRWKKARAMLAAAATHPTLRAHLAVLDAAWYAYRGKSKASARALGEAERLAEATGNELVRWDVARQRALVARRAGHAALERAELARAAAIAETQGWVVRQARLAARTDDDPRWFYGSTR